MSAAAPLKDAPLREALRRVAAGRNALRMAREMALRSRLAGVFDPSMDTIEVALAGELQKAEADAALIIGDGYVDEHGHRYTVAIEDRRARPRPARFMFHRNTANDLATYYGARAAAAGGAR